jgi:hypothetical protein
MSFQEVSKGVVKRSERRVFGLFIDGTGLDRATRRMKKKVDMTSLVRGVTGGIKPVVARYYTLIPHEDDSRQRAFLDAVSRAGLDVIVKRLPPKGVSRQVAVDIFMAADIIAFARGFENFSKVSAAHSLFAADPKQPSQGGAASPTALPFARHKAAQKIAMEVEDYDGIALHHIDIDNYGSELFAGPSGDVPADTKANGETSVATDENASKEASEKSEKEPNSRRERRVVTIVCPSRELAYPVSLVKEFGVDTVTADFGEFNTGDILKNAAKWIDLSNSETIWRES